MLKPMDDMNTALIEKSIRAIQQIDKKAVPLNSKIQTVIESIHSCSKDERFEEEGILDPFKTDKNVYNRKKLSNKIKIIIIAAIISALIAGIAVYAFTDIFSLFFNDPRDKLEWENGESRQIDNNEMIISSELLQFDSIEELKSVIDTPIICPDENSENVRITGIYYKSLKDRSVVYIDYSFNNVQINYAIHINSVNPTQEVIDAYEYERIETKNNNLFFMMELDTGYQGLARIGNNVYIITSDNKDDIIQFIRNEREL